MIPSPEDRRRIEELIQSDDSPVGIDAKKTHVMILALLERLDRRLEALEKKIEARDG